MTLEQQQRFDRRVKKWALDEKTIRDVDKYILGILIGRMDGAKWKKLYGKSRGEK